MSCACIPICKDVQPNVVVVHSCTERLAPNPDPTLPLPFDQDPKRCRRLGNVFCPDVLAAWEAHTAQAKSKGMCYMMRAQTESAQQGRVRGASFGLVSDRLLFS